MSHKYTTGTPLRLALISKINGGGLASASPVQNPFTLKTGAAATLPETVAVVVTTLVAPATGIANKGSIWVQIVDIPTNTTNIIITPYDRNGAAIAGGAITVKWGS
ncbi:MAG: hypothetical protein Q8N20_10140 [Eubacteriales bacterium]|nr:hypothetical protein [Eubacteriales bacterium]